MENIQQKKIIYLEVLRIISIFFVIFAHTNLKEQIFFNYSQINFRYMIFLFLTISNYFPVPIFFMISGSIFLNREAETISKNFKRILKYALILLITSIIYYSFFRLYLAQEKFNLATFLINLYTNNISIHLHFLYEYIFFLISLPILQIIAPKMKKAYYIIIIIVYIFAESFIPIFEYFVFNNKFSIYGINELWISKAIFVYPLIGYYLSKKNYTKKHIFLMWIINIFLIILTQILVINIRFDELTKDAYMYYIIRFSNCSLVINSITIYSTIKYIFSNIKISECIKKIICKLSSCTFGIYLFHIIFLKRYENVNSLANMFPILTTILLCIICYLDSFIFIYILKKIPVLNKFI